MGKLKNNLRYVGFFVILLILTFCGVRGEESTGYQAPEGAKLEKILEDFEQYAEKGMESWQIPGMSVAIIKGDKIIYSKGFGTKKLGVKDPVTENTVFQIGSTTKAFTATLVAMLVDEGKLDWNDRVIDHLPDFAMFDPWVTREFRIKDLMSQRSGMPGYSGDFQSFLGYDREHMIRSIRHIEPVSSFRSEFAYQNNLFLVAAKLIEKKTGKTWEQNIKERIMEPLEMSGSSVDMESYVKGADVSHIHVTSNGKVIAVPMDWKGFGWPYIYGPAGGINSNVIDMTKWLKFNYNNGKLNDEQMVSVENMNFIHSPKTIIGKSDNGPMQYYCNGWVHREFSPSPIIWHTGGTTGCSTMAAFIPNQDLAIIVLSNKITNHPQSMALYFFDRYYDKPIRDWSKEALEKAEKNKKETEKSMPKAPKNPASSLPLESFEGEYASSIYGSMFIKARDNRLTMTGGPAGLTFDFRHFDGNTFVIGSEDLFGGEDGFVLFETDLNRKVTGFDMKNADDGSMKFLKVQKK